MGLLLGVLMAIGLSSVLGFYAMYVFIIPEYLKAYGSSFFAVVLARICLAWIILDKAKYLLQSYN